MAENIKPAEETKETVSKNFIEQEIDKDLAEGVYDHVQTRFPPEPNGYLHIGHAKSIILNSGLAKEYGGKFNLRFDDTNPTKEKTEYVESIINDVKWLGAEFEDRLFFASDYFDAMYECAVHLIKKGKAFVCDLSADEIREYRGDFNTPGKNSPYRDRTVEENLKLFEEMKNGVYKDGEKVLRAKIDMASPNINMRDPVIYRVARMSHHNTGDKWCIYPMYDFAHPIGDALEGISHSLCSLEYEIHRPLYDWVVEHSQNMLPARPRQLEFARLNMTQTVMSKRYLRQLVEGGYVRGWDDPRMPTLSALRRRGYTGAAIRDFVDRIGMSKADSVVDLALLESCVRDDLGEKSPRAMAVLKPLKVVLTNWPAGEIKEIQVENHPDHPEMGTRTIRFGRELYIEQDDFMEVPAKKYQRMFPGNEVRLKGAYIVRCEDCVKDDAGEVVEVHCTVDLDSFSGSEGANRKIKGKTLHWVSAADAIPFEARLYEPLLSADEDLEEAEPELAEEGDTPAVPAKKDFISRLNPNSLTICRGLAEPAIRDCEVGTTFQFLRNGYFCKDPDSTPELPVYNRTVGLRDTFAKQAKK